MLAQHGPLEPQEEIELVTRRKYLKFTAEQMLAVCWRACAATAQSEISAASTTSQKTSTRPGATSCWKVANVSWPARRSDTASASSPRRSAIYDARSGRKTYGLDIAGEALRRLELTARVARSRELLAADARPASVAHAMRVSRPAIYRTPSIGRGTPPLAAPQRSVHRPR